MKRTTPRGEPPVVVVTGASAGIGRAVARHFGEQGWRVGLIARDTERLDAACREIEAAGSPALALPTDVADAAAVNAARDRVVGAWGGIDVWVNAAMVTVVSPIAQMLPEEYRRVTEVTYLGTLYGTLAALEPMRAQGEGAIVQVGSALSYRAIPLQSAYCAAKFAVRGFTDSLRCELLHEKSRIRVGMVQLPGVNTPQFDWARNRLPRKYKPVGAVHQPEVAARAIYRAALHGPRELWVGAAAIQAIMGQLAFPSLMDRRLASQAWEGQMDAEMEPPERPDNLFESVPGAVGAHGRFDSQAKTDAWILNPELARVGLAGSAAALGVIALGRRLSGRRKPG